MSQMNYFRRPQLAGLSMRRLPQAAVRGNKRRLNADANSAVPYFNVTPTGGGTLTVALWQGPASSTPTPSTVTVSFTATNGILTFASAISQLSSAVSSYSFEGFDWDGCLGVRSKSSVGVSWLWVVGGSLAPSLGFDNATQTNLTTFMSISGDIGSSPEGRISQPFGSAFPVSGESLTSDTFMRGLGRLSANSDVLYSELIRDEVVVRKVGQVTLTSATTLALDQVPGLVPGTKFFTDGGPVSATYPKILGSASTPTDISRFYFFVNHVTGERTKLQVSRVAFTSDSAQALGIDRQVASSAILGFVSGSVLKLASTNGISVGDYLEITGAGNGSWSNNGRRWAVEALLSDICNNASLV